MGEVSAQRLNELHGMVANLSQAIAGTPAMPGLGEAVRRSVELLTDLKATMANHETRLIAQEQAHTTWQAQLDLKLSEWDRRTDTRLAEVDRKIQELTTRPAVEQAEATKRVLSPVLTWALIAILGLATLGAGVQIGARLTPPPTTTR